MSNDTAALVAHARGKLAMTAAGLLTTEASYAELVRELVAALEASACCRCPLCRPSKVLADARASWPHFAELEPRIRDAMLANRRLSLRAAYESCVLPPAPWVE